MKIGFEEVISYLGLPAAIIIALVALQLICWLIELKGKVVPEFIYIIKFFKNRKSRRKQEKEMLVEMAGIIKEFNKHYSPECIESRNQWMTDVNNTVNWVHERADIYDASIAELKADFEHNKNIANKLYVQNCRTTILEFSAKIAQPNYVTTRDEFRRVLKVYDDYERFLEEIGEENGEIEDAIEVIRAIHRECIKENRFLEAKQFIK